MPMPDLDRLDTHFYLQGDEDCGVDLQCRVCDLRGRPIAHYLGVSPYPDHPDIAVVDTIAGFITAAWQHLAAVHPEEGSS